MFSVFLKYMVEALERAHKQAENSDVVTARDIQKILPELLLDF